jgi:FkbM family methyltransferase
VTEAPRGWRRISAIARSLPTRIAELRPPPSERCGTPAWAGAARVLIATFRGLSKRYRTTRVTIGNGPRVALDLRTEHGRRVFAYGFCEPAARAMEQLLRPGDVVIDGGANIGLFTLFAAALVGARGRVVACEPSPTTMELLRANVDYNRLEWVQLHEVAIAEKRGRLAMRVFEPGSGYSSFAPLSAEGASDVEVEVTTLDELARCAGGGVGLVKLDVEGAELRALRGATGLLAGSRPDFIVELEPDHLGRQGCSIAEVQELFENARYVGFSIADGLERLPRRWTRPRGDPNIVVRPRERLSA